MHIGPGISLLLLGTADNHSGKRLVLATSNKPQASSRKLDSWSGMCYYRIIKEKYMDKEVNGHLYIANDNLKRIADALEEILRLVKEDMERMKKIND